MDMERLVDRKSLTEIQVDGELDKLLSIPAATELAKKTGHDVLCDQGWPAEITGKEKRFTITASTISQVVSAMVCRPKSFPVRIPINYKCVWR